MSNWLLAVLGSVVAAGLCAAAAASWRRYRKGRGVFVGEWDQLIPPADDQPKKHDLVVCRHRGDHVYGTVQRIEPAAESRKRWRFDGRVHEQMFAAVFWSEDPLENSFGTMLLVHSGEHRYVGYYTKHRPEERNVDRIADERKRIKFEWVKRRIQISVGGGA